jgi:putative cell wall-binding protein
VAFGVAMVIVASLLAASPVSADEIEAVDPVCPQEKDNQREFATSVFTTRDCTITISAPPTVTRIQGTDRYDQAVQISRASFGEVETVYLASGEKFPDALSAGSVAGIHRSPLLLTPSGALTPGIKVEIARLQPANVVVVGGPASVSGAVVDDLERSFAELTVKRIGGADRFEVSRSLISDADFGVTSSTWIYLASGANFPDALAASPAAITFGAPVLLVDGTQTSPTTAETALFEALGVSNIQIAGGPASVSAAMETSLSVDHEVTRAGGADRFEAAVAVNQGAFQSFSSKVFLTSGLVFPDALSAAPVAGYAGNPIYLVRNNCVPKLVLQEIVRLQPTKIVILGGHNTINTDVEHLKSC